MRQARPMAEYRRATRQRRALTFAAYLAVIAVGIVDLVMVLALPVTSAQ